MVLVFAHTRQASGSKEGVLWFQGVKLPKVIHQLCDEIAVFTIHMFLPIFCHFWIKKRRKLMNLIWGFQVIYPLRNSYFNQWLLRRFYLDNVCS